MQSEGDLTTPIRVAIELDGFRDPISGSLAVGDAEPSPFAGWIELASRLEQARLAHRALREGGQQPGGLG